MLADLPTPTDLFTAVTAWSSPLFDALLPFAEYAVGFILGAFLIYFLIDIVSNLLHRSKGGH